MSITEIGLWLLLAFLIAFYYLLRRCRDLFQSIRSGANGDDVAAELILTLGTLAVTGLLGWYVYTLWTMGR